MTTRATSWTLVTEIDYDPIGYGSSPPVEIGTLTVPKASCPSRQKAILNEDHPLPATIPIPDAAKYLGIGRSAAS